MRDETHRELRNLFLILIYERLPTRYHKDMVLRDLSEVPTHVCIEAKLGGNIFFRANTNKGTLELTTGRRIRPFLAPGSRLLLRERVLQQAQEVLDERLPRVLREFDLNQPLRAKAMKGVEAEADWFNAEVINLHVKGLSHSTYQRVVAALHPILSEEDTLTPPATRFDRDNVEV